MLIWWIVLMQPPVKTRTSVKGLYSWSLLSSWKWPSTCSNQVKCNPQYPKINTLTLLLTFSGLAFPPPPWNHLNILSLPSNQHSLLLQHLQIARTIHYVRRRCVPPPFFCHHNHHNTHAQEMYTECMLLCTIINQLLMNI